MFISSQAHFKLQNLCCKKQGGKGNLAVAKQPGNAIFLTMGSALAFSWAFQAIHLFLDKTGAFLHLHHKSPI